MFALSIIQLSAFSVQGAIPVGMLVDADSDRRVSLLATTDIPLTSFASLRARFGPSRDAGGWAVRGDLGAVLSLDVWTWVPEAALLFGGRWDGRTLEPNAVLLLGLRRYVSLDTQVHASMGPTWRPTGFSAAFGLGLAREW